MKKVNLILSRKFPVKHPKAGKPTGLIEKALKGSKIHTIRDNIEYWQGKAERVNSGEMYVSGKMWLDQPYRSVQQEMFRLEKIGLQTIEMDYVNGILLVEIDGKIYRDHETLAANDGLSLEDFTGWFFSGKQWTYKGTIIHFTDFRY